MVLVIEVRDHCKVNYSAPRAVTNHLADSALRCREHDVVRCEHVATATGWFREVSANMVDTAMLPALTPT